MLLDLLASSLRRWLHSLQMKSLLFPLCCPFRTFEALGELYSTSLSENLKDRAGFLGGTVRKFTSYLMLHAGLCLDGWLEKFCCHTLRV